MTKMIEAIFQWILQNPAFLWLIGISLSTVIISAILVRFFVMRMQPDYFLPGNKTNPKHSPLRKLATNLIGGLLIIGGILMCFLPGQGLLTILIGLAVMDFPGKRNLEIRLFRLKPINWAVNKMRETGNREPLILPE